ncbi:MAG: excinuclease ABC subunit UvrC, partial [Chitinophagaceae bacterium]
RLRSMLKGNLSPVMQEYKKEMKLHAERLEFEKAAILKKKIEHLRTYNANSVIINPKLGDLDIFSIAEEEDEAFVNYLMVRNGTIVDTQTITLKKKLEEDQAEILQFSVRYFRDKFNSTANEIVLPASIDYPEQDIKCTIPKGGDKKKLLDMSLRNVNFFREDLQRRKRLHLNNEDADKSELLLQLQEDLFLQDFPKHIECFDNSNFQGSFPVSAMVCFREGIPSKKDYRHYNVQSVEGINDFATMKEVVFRRYKKLLDANSPLPQLVIIDGGKGQLSAALESIEELGLIGRMTLVGLAKNEEELFFAGDKESLKLPFNSPVLRFIRQVRDEVHRFGIRFHRKKRSAGTFVNELEKIKGIGKQTADQLLQHFRSVKKVSIATAAELSEIAGPAKAKIVFQHFHP